MTSPGRKPHPGGGRIGTARNAALALLGLIAVAAAGCGAPPARLDTGRPAMAPDGASVTVIDRGWHTDVALAADTLAGPLASVAAAFPGARFLVFGFGDREFYMSREESVLQTVRAMFPGPGVVLVTALKQPPADAFGSENAITLRVSCGDLAMVAAFVARTLATGRDGRPQALAEGPYPGSEFYASDETYDLFHNCNRWTAAALREAGLPVDPEGVVVVGQVMGQVRAAALAQRQLPSVPAAACAAPAG